MSNSKLIVSVSGIRGIVGDSLTAETALTFARALGTYLRGGTILLSCDGRANHPALKLAVIAGLIETGCHVVDQGVAPTPSLGIAIKCAEARGGIQITASHNPEEWNGLKLFGSAGRVLPAAEGEKIKALFESLGFSLRAWDDQGSYLDRPQALDWHLERILQVTKDNAIANAGFKVLVDANGGAGGPLASSLLQKLGCQITRLHCDADGVFDHVPEPTLENLEHVCPLVRETAADIGLAMDPDADRLALIDETGRYIGEELTLALAVQRRLMQQPGPVVINMSTSRVTEDVVASFGCTCTRSAVGEANVVDRMLEVGAVIGGEGNGGVIDPRVVLVRDPFIGMALILDLMATTNKKLSALAADLPSYAIVKDKVTIDIEKLPDLFAKLEASSPGAKVNREDGLRLDLDDYWVHVRPSNTEPIVRVIAESRSVQKSKEVCRQVGAMLQT